MKRWLVASTVLVVFGLVLVAAVAVWAWQQIHRPFGPADGAPVIVEIPAGLSATQILEELATHDLLVDPRLARLYLIWVLGDPPLRAGEYRFEPPLSTPEALAVVIEGAVVTYPITIIEGLTKEETADAIVAAGFGERERLLAAMRRTEWIADLDPRADDLEGYLFPDTYAFPRDTSEEKIVETLVRTFRQRFREQVEPLVGGEADVRSLVTLASIVEKEARLAEERPVIAGVYENRLSIGMALYADPTIIFALKRANDWDGNLRRPDLQLDSPYNTYLYPGLPPGPICSPGLGSLLAAARPADVPYLYFVSRNDGSHVFAETLAEHNRNVDQWQRQYWRERRARERENGDGSD